MATRRHDEARDPNVAEATADANNWASVEEATELLHEERYLEALTELRRVLRREPRNPYAFYFLGIAFFEAGELDAARDAYLACVKLAPKHLGARVALCHLLRITGDVRGAIRQGIAALSLTPGDPDALYAVGLAYSARGDDVAARKYLEAFLETGPEPEAAFETRALLATLAGGPSQENDED
jgi:Flp pilus assembly protein TadD